MGNGLNLAAPLPERRCIVLVLDQDQEALVAREPGMNLDQARLVLSHMQVPNEDGLYVLGCFEKRVTLRSQQVRALNLICALDAAGALKGQGRIAVIGGGAAGMTAAAGAARLGYEVTLLEKKSQLLPLFRGNTTRWLHPHIYDWPDTPGTVRHDGGSLHPDEAGLPLLSWRADLAGRVADQLEAEWQSLPERSRIEIVLGVQSINLGTGKPRSLSWNAPGRQRGSFDAVILAVGFGLENPFKNVLLVSYWDNERWHQPTRGGTERYLVSGCGDGGLIDLLRLKIEDFRHENVVRRFLGAPKLESLKQKLLHIEEQAQAREARREDPGAYLEEQYESLKVPEEVDKAFKLRKDTDVSLNGRGHSPLTLNASILNRFLTSRLLYQFRVVPYREGEFAAERKDNGGYEVRFQTGPTELFHHIICRHGPVRGGEIGESFPQVLAQCGDLQARNKLDQTRRPLWERGFFDPGGDIPPSMPGTQSPDPSTGGDMSKSMNQGPFVGISTGSLKEGFKGRERDLEALHALLQGTGKVALTSGNVGPVYAHGGGGMGKSRLAIEYAHRYRKEYPGGVFFKNVGERAPQAIFAEFARDLLGERAPPLEDEAALAFVRELEELTRGPCLLIFDDVQARSRESLARRFSDPMQVHGYPIWPIPYSHVSLLITTRMREIEREIEGAKNFFVERLDAEAATELLQERARPRTFSLADHPEVRRVASEELGGHPLAIRLAGAYLGRVKHLTVAEYHKRLRQQGRINKLEVAANEVGYTIRDHECSIAATYELSCRQLDPAKSVDVLALQLLMITSFLAPNTPIDPGLLQRVLKALGGTADQEQVGLALARLEADLSLLDAVDGGVVIHPLIADYTRGLLEPDRKREIQKVVLGVMMELFPNTRADFWRITQRNAQGDWEWLSPQREVHAIAVWRDTDSIADWNRARLSDRLGDLFMHRGSFAHAQEAYEQAIMVSQQCLESDSDNPEWQHSLAVSYGKFGDALREIGRKADALEMYQKAAAISRRQTMIEPKTSQWWRDLVVSLERLGDMQLDGKRFQEAGVLYNECRSICEHWVEKEPSNLKWRNALLLIEQKLGELLRAKGDSQGAQEAYKRILDVREEWARQGPFNAQLQRHLGVTYGRMGLVLSELDNSSGSRACYLRALAIFRDLVQKDSTNAQWQTDLALSLFHLAVSLLSSRSADRHEGRRYLVEARGVLVELQNDSRLAHEEANGLLPDVDNLLQALDSEVD